MKRAIIFAYGVTVLFLLCGTGWADEAEADRTVRQKLANRIPKLDFTNLEFKDVIDFFQKASNANFHVNWKALAGANIDAKTPVNLSLTDVTVEKALQLVLQDLSANTKVTFIIDDGVVRISTKDELDGKAPSATRPATQPTSVRANAPALTYCVVPLHGEIGLEVTAEVLRKALTTAKYLKVDMVILHIDSPGGLVSEKEAILEVLREYPNMRVVAFVHEGSSAAAVIGMACKEIVMNNAGTIGATVIIGGSGHALADDNTTVGQKRLSWYTAKDKATVESAGHNSLIVEGMSLPDIVLSVTTVNGKPAVVEGESGKMLKATGKILSLTGKEAVACGLAVGTADSVAECLAVLGADKATEGKAASNQAEGLFKERATAIRAASNSYNGLLDKVKDNIAVVRAERAAVDPRKRISSIKIIEESLTVAIVLAKRYPTLCDRGTMSYPEDLQRILDEWVALRKQAEAKK